MNEYIQDHNVRRSCYAAGVWTITLVILKITGPLPLFIGALLLYTIPLTCLMLSVMQVMEVRDRRHAIWEVYLPIRQAESELERSYREFRGKGPLVITYRKGLFGWDLAGIRHLNDKEAEFYVR